MTTKTGGLDEINTVVEEISTSITTPFIVPKDYNVYISQINEKVNNLVKHNIWRGIEKIKLKQWMKNFDSPEELYFAACVLDNLIYRNNAQTESMLYNLISIDIPNLLHKHKPKNVNPYITLFGFKNSIETNVRLVCVKGEFDGPSKSSHFVARMLKRKMLYAENWMITPDLIKPCMDSGIKCFIFIDDFLGTGSQFEVIADEIELNKKLQIPDAFFAYAPLVAHKTGIDFLVTKYPGLKITCVEKLDESNSLFNSAFNDGVNNPINSREFYTEYIKRKSAISALSSEDLFGFGELALTYVFEEACADNNLPLIYWNRNSSINSLFYR